MLDDLGHQIGNRGRKGKGSFIDPDPMGHFPDLSSPPPVDSLKAGTSWRSRVSTRIRSQTKGKEHQCHDIQQPESFTMIGRVPGGWLTRAPERPERRGRVARAEQRQEGRTLSNAGRASHPCEERQDNSDDVPDLFSLIASSARSAPLRCTPPCVCPAMTSISSCEGCEDRLCPPTRMGLAGA